MGNRSTNRYPKHTRKDYWQVGTPNNIETIRVCTDGSWKEKPRKNEGQAAIAWTIFEDPTGMKYSDRILAMSPLQTEARAVLQAATTFQWKCANLEIKTECLEIVRSLRNPQEVDKEISSILKEIKIIANTFQFFKCTKATRQEVACAHNLANKMRRGR